MEMIKGWNYMPIAIGMHPVPLSIAKLNLGGEKKSIKINYGKYYIIFL
jgi:hypothetical protein